ncbi:UNKNOWN [Stylonychia lemnae]|uniref:C2 NT-type domain-containing protein n=1 Tax=Stylonychia lemnae TaxID=5949 RepID=A0A078AT12_STYLE|nr:UNKNOWN [Stylonychia lemnae]|eukprot:CDW83998.1 UNKNOWN [Stylonychia lemnae]
MVEGGPTQKTFNLDLHIKQLCIKVTEPTVITITWQRGGYFSQKAQYSKKIYTNRNNRSQKSKHQDKQSSFTINGNTGKGLLGEADLNLSDYQENEFRYMKLPLRNCSDPDAYLEVGLKATQAREKKTDTPKASQSASGQKDNEASKEQMIQILDDMDKERKLQKKNKQEYDEKIRGLNEKINNLQTTLENTKTDLTHLQKQQKGLSQEKEVMSKDIDILKLKIGQKEDAVHEKEKDIKDQQVKLKNIQGDYDKIHNEIEAQKNVKDQEVKDLQAKIDQTFLDFKKLYDFDKFDTDYLGCINTLFANTAAPSSTIAAPTTIPRRESVKK